MRIGRTLPPAASPIGWKSFFDGLIGLFHGEKELERFKGELCSYFGKRHCFLLSSGKAALTLILLALKEKYPGRAEVIIPAYTCYSVPSAIVRAGLEIKLCDLEKNSFDFNFEQLGPMLESDRLLAVLPTHLFGLPADVERLKTMIHDPQVTVIEDAAQAMGSEWQGKKLGTQGDVGFFSLGRGKAFSTVEGGIILTDDDPLAETLQKQIGKLENYGSSGLLKLIFYTVALNILLHPCLFWIPKAIPFLKLGETIFDPDFPMRKMTAFQAGLANNWVDRLRELRTVRQNNIRQWMTVIDKSLLPFLQEGEKGFPELIRLPILLSGSDKKARLLAKSERGGLGAAIAYPDVISGIAECAEGFKGQEFPLAQEQSPRLMTLPVHVFVKREDMNRFAGLV